MHRTRQHKGNEQDRAVCLKTTNENEPENDKNYTHLLGRAQTKLSRDSVMWCHNRIIRK